MLISRDMPPLRLLTTFEAVLRMGGVQNAAAGLNVTQPAVSQAIRALEDHVGVKLLDRRVRPATPTEAGKILFQALSRGFDQIEQAIGQIKAMQRVDQNVVTVACTICTGTYWLMPRLAAFYNRYPDITVRVVASAGIPRFAPDTDLLIRYGTGDWPDGKSEVLFRERLVPVCNPQVLVRFGSGNLEKATLLHVESEDDCWPGWSDYLEATGLPSARQADRIFSNYVEATQAALAGIGMMLGWISNTADLRREGRLVVFRDHPLDPDGAFHLVHPCHDRIKEASAVLAAHLHDCAGNLPTGE